MRIPYQTQCQGGSNIAQFTPEGLARLLSQVEREVLVEALEIADLTSLLLNAHIQTLDEVAGWLNLIENTLLFADSLRDRRAEEIIQEALEGFHPGTQVGRGFAQLIDFFLGVDTKLIGINDAVERLIELDDPVDPSARYLSIRRRTHNKATDARSALAGITPGVRHDDLTVSNVRLIELAEALLDDLKTIR